MRKSDKKRERHIINGLTRVCENAKIDVDGFEWLTHPVAYADFPNSLMVYCIFDTAGCIEYAVNSGKDLLLFDSICKEFSLIDINFKGVSTHVFLVTESEYERRVK